MAKELRAKLIVEAQTEGRDDIDHLAGEMEALARSGSDAAPRLAELAQNLRMLGQQEKAIKGFADLRAQVSASERSLKQLTGEADRYAEQIGRAGPPTAVEAANLERLRQAAERTSSTLSHQRTVLSEAAANLQRHGAAASGTAQSLERVRAQIQQTVQSARELAPALSSAEQGWRGSSAAADAAKGSISAAGQAAHRMAGQLAAMFTFREALQAVQDMEKLRAGLTAVMGDAKKAGEELEFIKRVANESGTDVVAVGNAYLGLAASVKGTAVEGQMARDVFLAVSTAMAKAGKSSAETQNALLALQQMAGKGVVSMEEMRQQLGEALPGAFQAAAKGMGITVAELNKLIESGQVTARDIFPALTKGLNEVYGASGQGQTLAQEITNIKNAFIDMASYIGESGGEDELKKWAERGQAAITMLGVGLVDFGRKAGTVIGALVSRDFSQLQQAFDDIEKEGRDKLVKAAAHNEQLRAAIGAVGSEADKAALAVQQQAAATQQAAEQAAAAEPSYAALSVAYVKARDALKDQIDLTTKGVAAAKARGDALVAEARLLGDEAGLRKAIGTAAAGEATALSDLAQARQTEVDVMTHELANKRAILKASGDESDERKKELETLEQSIAAKQVEADAARAQAAAAQANARAKGEEVQAAQAALAAAQAASIARVSEARNTVALLEAQKRMASTNEQVARLMGNEEAARRYKIEQLRLEIQITKAKAEVQKAEAEGSIAAAKATLAEMAAKGESNKVREAELNAVIKAGEAKLKEAAATADAARATERAVQNLRDYGDAVDQSAKKAVKATEDTTEASKDARDAQEQLAQATEHTWLSATAAASKYRDEAAAHADALEGKWQSLGGHMIMGWGDYFRAWNNHFATLRKLADEYAAALESVDARQQDLQRANSGAASGVEELRLRLLELNGSEEDIARARAERERKEIEYQLKLAQLEVERAAVRGDTAEAERQRQEIALLEEQLKLLDQIHATEKKRRADKAKNERSGEGGGTSSSSGGASSSGTGGGISRPTDVTVNFTVNGINDPAQLARMMEPEFRKLARLAR